MKHVSANDLIQFVALNMRSTVLLRLQPFCASINVMTLKTNMNFPTVTINTKFLNSLQPEWLKYVTQVRLANQLTVDSFDDIFDYLQQFEKLVNALRGKKLEKSHDLLALAAHTGRVHNNSEDPLVSAMLLLAKAISQNFSNPTNNSLRASSNTKNQAIIQGDRMNIQSRKSGNTGRNGRQRALSILLTESECYNCSEKRHMLLNCPKPKVSDSKMEEIEDTQCKHQAKWTNSTSLIHHSDDGPQLMSLSSLHTEA
ncbi:hypothetical protein Tco_1327004 [Tanacetum coccineum]